MTPGKMEICQPLKRQAILLFMVIATVLCLLGTGRYYEQKDRYQHVIFKGHPKTPNINFIFYTVKTSKKFYDSRLDVVLKTWFQKVKNNVFFISDEGDKEYDKRTGHRLVSTNCPTTHARADLCCKLDYEFSLLATQQASRWWCHFDDDDYVNVRNLEKLLRKYDWRKPWYIGRRTVDSYKARINGTKYPYQFAHGGSGFCMTTVLAKQMTPWIGEGKFMQTCEDFHLTDDCAVGFIVTHLLNVSLTESVLFHSHWERLKNLTEETLHEQISLSYKNHNRISLSKDKAKFDEKQDPTRLLSFHCLIYPKDKLCL